MQGWLHESLSTWLGEPLAGGLAVGWVLEPNELERSWQELQLDWQLFVCFFWLVGWMLGCLGWLINVLLGCFVGCLLGCQVCGAWWLGCLDTCLVGLLLGCLVGCLSGYQVYFISGVFVGWLLGWLHGWLVYCLDDWLGTWWHGMLDGWFGGWTCMCWERRLVVELRVGSNGCWIVGRMLGLLAW